MRVLVACEESQAVCKAFRERGHEAYSCDLQECSGGHPEWHIIEDALEVIRRSWDLIIAHPPCTYLSNLGSNHLYMGTDRVWRHKDEFRLMNEKRVRLGILARDFFKEMLNAPCAHVAVENPVPCSLWQLPPPHRLFSLTTSATHSRRKRTCGSRDYRRFCRQTLSNQQDYGWTEDTAKRPK